MSQPYLPIEENGEAVEFPSLRVWCEMCYADNRLAALRAWQQLSTENVAMNEGTQSGYSRISDLVQKDMVSKMNIGKLSGYVACQMRWNCLKRGSPQKDKAVFAVSEYYSSNRTVSGKNIPTDIRRLRGSVNAFAPVLHLWAAFVLLEESEGAPEAFFQGDEVFDRLLILALDMQRFLTESGAFKPGDPIFDNLLPLPPSIEQKYLLYGVQFPEEPAWVEETLEGYSANAGPSGAGGGGNVKFPEFIHLKQTANFI